MAASRFWQSDSKGSINRFVVLLFISMTMLKVSISTIWLSIPSSLAMSRPSRRAHDSAMELLVLPRALAYPLTQFPKAPISCLPRISQGKPVRVELHPTHRRFFPSDLDQFLHSVTPYLSPCGEKFSAVFNALRMDRLSTTPDLKRKLFRVSHKCQSPIGKIIFHGMPR